MPSPKTFYIIDGHAQIFRAYFAPFRNLTGPNSEPTKATFVFTQWLVSLAEKRKPDYLAMTIDSGDERTFRAQIYPEYKAQRESPPDDFSPQEKRILQLVAEAGIPIFAKVGFEADDLIATMAHRLRDSGYRVIIVSKDKDLRQILDDNTVLYDVQSDAIIDGPKMTLEHGYTPAQAIDVQTLMGDTVDNVPGIPGIGAKTAAKLITQYGNIDGIYDHLDDLTPKLRENLETYKDRLPLARKLVTLRDDVEMEFDPEACKFEGLGTPAFRGTLERLGFTTLVKRLAPLSAPEPDKPTAKGAVEVDLFGPVAPLPEAKPPETAANCNYCVVRTAAEFDDFLKQIKKQKRFAFDTETDALGAMNSNLVGMSFSWQAGQGFYVPVDGPGGSQHLTSEQVLPKLKPILENPDVKKFGHNIKYDLLVMRQQGIRIQGVELDSMVASFLLDAGRMQFGIDRLALDLLNFSKVPTSDLIGKGKNQISMRQVDLDLIGRYAAEDADIAWRLALLLEARLAEIPELKKLCDELETPLIDVLVEMESNGIAVDPAVLKEQSQVLGERAQSLREKIFAAAGTEFNPDSPKQLQEILFTRLGLPIVKRTKTGPSTDVEVLDKLADRHPVPKLILDYRSVVKLKNTYLDNLTEYLNPRTGRIHASFNQTGAATGRLSCSDPNLQNIPIRTDEGRRIRLAFVPGDRKNNVLMTADYSQIELRVLAHFTREPALMAAFDADEDIHKAVAAEVFGVPLDKVTRDQRNQAKTINFGIIYGVTAFGLSRRIEGLTVSAASELIDRYNKRFPTILTFLDRCVMEARSQGYVQTILGRRRPITEVNSNIMSVRNAGERMAINSVVQGSAADLIKVAMLNVYRRIQRENRPSRLLLQVHDELVFETPADAVEADAEMVRQEMCAAMKLAVPLKVEVGWGKNWQEVK